MTVEEYNREREKAIKGIREGVDPYGSQINVIFAASDEFFVYDIKGDDSSLLCFLTTKEMIDPPGGKAEKFNFILPEWSKVKSHISKFDEKRDVKIRLAHTLLFSLTNEDIHNSKNQFINLEKEILSEYKKIITNRFALSATPFVFVIFLSFICIFINFNPLIKSFLHQNLILLYNTACASSIGGLISFYSKIKAFKIFKYVDNFYYIMVGFERMLISIAVGIVGIVALKSNLILGLIPLNSSKSENFLLIFAVLCGFSESLIPSILTKAESSVSLKK